MADITKIPQLSSGVPRDLDLTTNTPVVSTLKVGGATPTELTKTHVDSLIAAGPVHPSLGFTIVEHWMSSSAVGNTGWTILANSGSVGMSGGTQQYPGMARIDTFTSATSAPSLYLGGNSATFGSASFSVEAQIQFSALSTVVEEYSARIGMHNSLSATSPTNGIWFEYDRLTSTNWICKCKADGVETATTTSTAVVATTFLKLKIEINAAGTSVVFKVNDATVATITTNIPVGGTRYVWPNMQMVKSAGTTSRYMNTDWFVYQCRF